MTLLFTKMHGLGNDFMVIDAINQSVQLNQSQIKRWANRHTGIGFDQCLVVEPSNNKDIDFNYRIFNADGQEVGQCGNGARCLALFLKEKGLTAKCVISVSTPTTQMQLIINDDHTVSVDMGHPLLSPEQIPLLVDAQADTYSLTGVEGATVTVHAINVGNPHAVLQVDKIETAPVDRLGRELSQHSRFPDQANVGFMEVISKDHIKLRVYERGCGETLACGSGAVAAAAVGRLFHQLSSTVKVSLPGGDLVVTWPDPSSTITLTGPAVFVYEGKVLSCA